MRNKFSLVLASLAIGCLGLGNYASGDTILLTATGEFANLNGGPDQEGLAGDSFELTFEFAEGTTFLSFGSFPSTVAAPASSTSISITDSGSGIVSSFDSTLQAVYAPAFGNGNFGGLVTFNNSVGFPLAFGSLTGADISLSLSQPLFTGVPQPASGPLVEGPGDLLTLDSFGSTTEVGPGDVVFNSFFDFTTSTDYGVTNLNVTATAVPEPSSLVVLGISGLVAIRRRR